ncbi:MAG: nucleotide sugar dehydrogenase [Gemmatimonadales bacterium]
MPLTLTDDRVTAWTVRKIGVIGPGIVGMPMAALLADAGITEGSETPAEVVVVQRASPTSGWKVEAINRGRSPIGGIEPDLDAVVARAATAKRLRATHDVDELQDADVILVCVQTDKAGNAPDYGPMYQALRGLAQALRRKPAGNIPLVIFESTLAPSSMTTVMRELFAEYGLVEGRDILLGNSPNRVMPGRLVERVAASDKIVAGLHPETPGLIARLYRRIVTRGVLHPTSSMTAEVVKTLENAYRDVRIAYAAEVVRYCDRHDIDFYRLREQVNRRTAQSDRASGDPNAVPSGGLLVPTVGVGGHCLPKDGILLWWRLLEAGEDTSRSLILEARRINDESPGETLALAEKHFGSMAGRRIALLGTAYRFNSEDTRNSPTLPLARLLLAQGASVTLHDPYVHERDANLAKYELTGHFTRDLGRALAGAEFIFFCTGHRAYLEGQERLRATPGLLGVVDGCNLLHRDGFAAAGVGYTGIGRGQRPAPPELIEEVEAGFRAVERGVANEVAQVIEYLNRHHAPTEFNRVMMADVQRIAGTCPTGCLIVDPGPVAAPGHRSGFTSRLAARALGAM